MFLKELAKLLLEFWMVLLNFMERFGSVEVWSLLFRDLIVFQYVVVFCLLSHGVFTWFCQISCLWSIRF